MKTLVGAAEPEPWRLGTFALATTASHSAVGFRAPLASTMVDADEHYVRTYVSTLWAIDWGNPDDAVYDTYE